MAAEEDNKYLYMDWPTLADSSLTSEFITVGQCRDNLGPCVFCDLAAALYPCIWADSSLSKDTFSQVAACQNSP